jgi:hypothetical protein
MTPLLPIQQPYLRDLMASIKVIGKLSSGAKHSRMGKLSEKFQKWFFENLRVASTPLKCFLNGFGQMSWLQKKRSWWFYNSGIVYKYSPNQLSRATTLP